MRYIVQCVEERMGFVKEMQAQIPALEIFTDNIRGADTAYRTFMEILAKGSGDPVVHILLCEDFVSKIEAVIERHPNDLIQFFSMRKDDLTIGSRWIAGAKYLMNQCFYSPKNFDILLLEYAKTWRPKAPANNTAFMSMDAMMRDFLKLHNARYWNHVPNLVDHRVAKSMIDPRRSSKRQSFTFRLS